MLAQLTFYSLDGKTYDIIVDYGKPIPSKNVFYSSPPPSRKQAVCFNMDPEWRWGPESPVHFIAHSQGGNTCRYLIHLLERGWSEEGSAYFTKSKRGWVKSLTTLSTPHNGTSIINALNVSFPLFPVVGDLVAGTDHGHLVNVGLWQLG